MSSLSWLNLYGEPRIVQILHTFMQDQVNKLQKQVDKLTKKLEELTMSQSPEFKGSLDDVQVERVFNTDISGTPSTNTLLRNITVSVSVPYSLAIPDPLSLPTTLTGTLTGTGTITVLDYPERIKIDTWKGQRLAIPVYDATKIIYP